MTLDTSSYLRRIGAGGCGSVWAAEISSWAFKRGDGGQNRSLRNDSEMHQLVQQCRQLNSIRIRVPDFERFITPDDAWWNGNQERFTTGYNIACNLIKSERIPAMGQAVREMLLEKYCPSRIRSEVKFNRADQDCLIRPYLGRCRYPGPQRCKFRPFTLRNYPLHLNQMEELQLGSDNITTYAEIMAETLAFLHWYVGINADDVEFVLAPPPKKNHDSPILSNRLGEHIMWLLDFDRCKKMPFDDEGIDMAVAAYFRNDPYYPRPHQPLWEPFKSQYIQSSALFLQKSNQTGIQRLPSAFIQRIEERSQGTGQKAGVSLGSNC